MMNRRSFPLIYLDSDYETYTELANGDLLLWEVCDMEKAPKRVIIDYPERNINRVEAELIEDGEWICQCRYRLIETKGSGPKAVYEKRTPNA